MKQDIHPKYEKSTVVCSCGNTFETKSTTPEIHVEICSVCHPFYTGKQKLVDTAGRVDKFRTRMEASSKLKDTRMANSAKKVERELAEGKTKEAVVELDKDIEEIKEEIAEETVITAEEMPEQAENTEEPATEE